MRSKCFQMLEKCEPPPEQWIFMWLGTLQRGVTCTFCNLMSQQLWGTQEQQVNYEFVCFSFFLSGWLGRCSGAWRVTHEGFYQGEWWSAVEHDESTWGFLLGWMRYSGAWRVNLEGFCKGEWQGAVKHDEPTMRFLSGWMGRCSGAWWSKEVNMVLNVHRNHEAY